MTALITLQGDKKYVFDAKGALAEWIDKEKRTTALTLYGYFPSDPPYSAYTVTFNTDIAFSLCKKLEKESVADLTTNFIREQIINETFA